MGQRRDSARTVSRPAEALVEDVEDVAGMAALPGDEEEDEPPRRRYGRKPAGGEGASVVPYPHVPVWRCHVPA